MTERELIKEPEKPQLNLDDIINRYAGSDSDTAPSEPLALDGLTNPVEEFLRQWESPLGEEPKLTAQPAPDIRKTTSDEHPWITRDGYEVRPR